MGHPRPTIWGEPFITSRRIDEVPILIYDNEKEWQKFPKDVQDKYMSEGGDLYQRLGSTVDAMAAYKRALELATQEPERRFISGRLDELRLTSPR